PPASACTLSSQSTDAPPTPTACCTPPDIKNTPPPHRDRFGPNTAMSALGQKRTFAVREPMSALPSFADMCGALRDVGFGPKADIGTITAVQGVTRLRAAKSP